VKQISRPSKGWASELKNAAKLALDSGQNKEALQTYLELAKLFAVQGNFSESMKFIFRAREFTPQVYENSPNPGQILTEYIAGRVMKVYWNSLMPGQDWQN